MECKTAKTVPMKETVPSAATMINFNVEMANVFPRINSAMDLQIVWIGLMKMIAPILVQAMSFRVIMDAAFLLV